MHLCLCQAVGAHSASEVSRPTDHSTTTKGENNSNRLSLSSSNCGDKEDSEDEILGMDYFGVSFLRASYY